MADTVTTPETELLAKLDAGFPPEWRANKKGDVIVGAFLRLETGPTQFGPAPIVILGTSEGERSVWVFWNSLKSGLERAAPAPGETIAIRYEGLRKVKNQTPGRRDEYHDYRVAVDRPAQAEEQVDWSTALRGPGQVGVFEDEPEPDDTTPF